MLATQNFFSLGLSVTVFACRGVNYIKKCLSIRQLVGTASGNKYEQLQRRYLIRRISGTKQRKMDYLRYFYDQAVGYIYGTEDGYNCSTPRKLVAFGNVLLDTTAHLNDTSLLEKFNLTPDSRGELDNSLITEIRAAACANNDCTKNPGGAALNTSRIIAKLGTEPTFFGAIGEDEAGAELKQLISTQLADVRLQSVDDASTGQCIALIHNDKSTLYANIGASEKFSIEYLQSQERLPFLRPIERKQVIYIEGFFIPHREEVCNYIVEKYIHDRRRLAINLSSDYIVRENSEQILKLVHDAFFIFGNETEFNALMEVMSCKSEMDMAQELTKQGRVVKIIAITKGNKGVTLISNFDEEFQDPGNLSIQSYNAQRVENVVDTTGAGDAFVAAFLHYWLQKRRLSECVRLAADIASKICTQIGCRLPEEHS